MSEQNQPIDAEIVPTQAVAVRPQTGLPTVADLEQQFTLAVRQRELLSDYIKKQLVPGKHFYQRGDQKPSLSKEGAEIILLPHNLAPDYEQTGGPDKPPEDGRPYQITVKCTLRRKGDPTSFVGSGIGSAGSEHRSREGNYTPRQPDKYLCHNATLKMAQKSAMIAATINSTAASEFFTQDMSPEDGNVPGRAAESGPPSSATQPHKTPPAASSARVPPSPEQFRAKFVANMDEGKLREKATQFCIDLAWLMPNESLEGLPFRFVPQSKEQYVAFLAKLTAWSASGKAEKPYEANPEPGQGNKSEAGNVPRGTKPVEVPRDKNMDCNSPDAPWRSYPVPFGKHAGTKLADLDKNVLYGFAANYKPEEFWTNKEGKKIQTKPEKLAKDRKFREMLTEASNHYQFKYDDQEPDGNPSDGDPAEYGDS